MKQSAGLLVLVALLIGYGWYGLLVDPARPTDIYSPRSRLILLVPASLFLGVGVGGLLYGALRKRNS
jgi:hypothetical protein